MEYELKQFLELVRKIEAYFRESIIKAEADPNNHNILKEQFFLPNTEPGNSFQVLNTVFSSVINVEEGTGFGNVSFQRYSNALLEALKNSPNKTAEILEAHQSILKLIKNFSELKWQFIEKNNHTSLPSTYITVRTNNYVEAVLAINDNYHLSHSENAVSGNKSLFSSNDLIALLKIGYTIDLINSQLNAYLKTEKRSNFVKKLSRKQKTPNLSLIGEFLNGNDSIIRFENIDTTPLPNEFRQMIYKEYIEPLSTLYISMCSDKIAFNKYETYREAYYGQGLPIEAKRENPRLTSTKKPQISSVIVEKKLKNFCNNSKLFSTMLEYYKLTKYLRDQKYIKQHNASYLKKIPHKEFLNTAHAFIRLMRFSQRLYIGNYLEHKLDKNSRLYPLLDHFSKSAKNSKKYFETLKKNADSLTNCESFKERDRISKTHLKKHPQTKHFIEKLTSSFKANILHSFDQRNKYTSLYDREQMIRSASEIIKLKLDKGLNLSENEMLIAEALQQSNMSIEMQEKKFELEYLNNLLDWRQNLMAQANENIDSVALRKAKSNMQDDDQNIVTQGYFMIPSDMAYEQQVRSIGIGFLAQYNSVVDKTKQAFGFDARSYINAQIAYGKEDTIDLSDLDSSQKRAATILLSCLPDCAPLIEENSNVDNWIITPLSTLIFYYKLFREINDVFASKSVVKIKESYQAQKKLYEDAMIEQEADAAEGDSNATQNSIESEASSEFSPYKQAPITLEDRLAQHNQDLFEQHQQKSEELRQQYTSQKTYVPLFEQLYLNQQVNAQQNVQNNIIQLQPRIHRQFAATGTDGFTVSSHARRSHNHIAPIRQLPTAQNSGTKASPSFARVNNIVHPTGMMISGMYISRVIAYKATHNTKFADRISELSAYPIASALLFYYANNVGVTGGFTASSKAALYYTATKAPPVLAATAVATIIATPFVQLKRYADIANYSANRQRENIINTTLLKAGQGLDYFAKTFYSHDERDDLLKERYGVISLNKTQLQISRDTAFMDYELADTALSTITTMLDIKQDEALSKKKSVLFQIRSDALSFLKSTYPKPQSSHFSFGSFDHFK